MSETMVVIVTMTKIMTITMTAFMNEYRTRITLWGMISYSRRRWESLGWIVTMTKIMTITMTASMNEYRTRITLWGMISYSRRWWESLGVWLWPWPCSNSGHGSCPVRGPDLLSPGDVRGLHGHWRVLALHILPLIQGSSCSCSW